MNILALDPGTRMGFCVGSSGAHISGVWDLKGDRFESASMRLIRLVKQLDEMHAARPIDRVVYEEVRRHAGSTAAHWYGAYWGQIIKWCEERGIPYEGVPVGSIKKFWTGNGACSKAAMIEAAQERGYVTEDDNEADALALFNLKTNEEEKSRPQQRAVEVSARPLPV